MPISSLAKKLHIRPGHTVALVNAPEGAIELIAPLPDDAKVVTSTKGKPDLILYFVKSIAELDKAAKELKKSLEEETVLWFAYPKVSSKVTTDLARDRGWKSIYEMGLIGVASIAIDNTWSALRFRTAVDKTEDELITKQYDDSRAAWRPLYDQIATLARNLGPDVELIPRQNYVAFSRGKQFALVKPSRDRLDLVLKLSGPTLNSRLQPALGMGSGSMTHCVAITKAEDIDRQVITWLQEAYRNINR